MGGEEKKEEGGGDKAPFPTSYSIEYTVHFPQELRAM